MLKLNSKIYLCYLIIFLGCDDAELPLSENEQLIADRSEIILSMDDDRLNQIRKYAVKRVINEFNLEFQSQLFRDFYY